jgi:ATP-dependent Clp protease ATP-binding subunit ClpA
MPDHKDLKRLIRARMRKTGESYTAARAQVLKQGSAGMGSIRDQLRETNRAVSALGSKLLAANPTAEPASEGTSVGMPYPFDRFTERAKRVLTLAQEEAQRSHHSYIGTEHLLLGVLQEREGLAAMVLDNLGVEISKVRGKIETVLGRNERIIIAQIIPTSRVKKVIEISFEEARRMGNNYVGSEHLLLGLLIEGKGIAALVLQDLGADLDKVRSETARLLTEPGWLEMTKARIGVQRVEDQLGIPAFLRSDPTSRPRATVASELTAILEAATKEAWQMGEQDVKGEHLVLALLARRSGPGFRVLHEANLSATGVRRRLKELRAAGGRRGRPRRASG